MARINNTRIYPTRQVSVGGMLLGTAPDGRTVNFLGGIGSTYGVNGLKSGGLVWVSGLTYKSVNLSYMLNGEMFYIEDDTLVTLDASPTTGTDKRIDIIYGDENGVLGVKKGTESENPITPTLEPYLLELHFALLDTNATEPSDVEIEVLYLENEGQPSEWDVSESTGAAYIDIDSSVSPLSGDTSIKVTEITSSVFLPTLTFEKDTTIAFDSFNSLSLDVLLSSTWTNSYLFLGFYNGSNIVARGYIDSNNLDYNNTSTAQSIHLFKSNISLESNATEFDSIKVFFRVPTGRTISCTIDNVKINLDDRAVEYVLVSAEKVTLDASQFNNNLDSDTTNVQKLADKVDDLSLSPFVIIDNFLVLKEGKTDLENWEDGDKFEGWVGNIYYTGRVVDASTLAMPADINTSKVSLALNQPAL